MQSQSVLKLGLYRHTKSGKLYRVLGLAMHTETEESLVVYEPQYDSEVRPVDMFLETVVIDGVARPRFEFIHA